MVDITEEEIAAAQERGRIVDDREPRATAVRYDRATGQVVVELKHTATFSFPARLAQGLENATDDEIAEVSIIGGGYGLHWETLDVDHAVPALVAGHFGTRRYMSNLVERGIIRATEMMPPPTRAYGGRPPARRPSRSRPRPAPRSAVGA